MLLETLPGETDFSETYAAEPDYTVTAGERPLQVSHEPLEALLARLHANRHRTGDVAVWKGHDLVVVVLRDGRVLHLGQPW